MSKAKKKTTTKAPEKAAAKKSAAPVKAEVSKKTAATKSAAAPTKSAAAKSAAAPKKAVVAKSAATPKKTGAAKAAPAAKKTAAAKPAAAPKKAAAAKAPAAAKKAAPARKAAPAKKPAAAKKPAKAPVDVNGSVAHLIHRAEQCAGDIFAKMTPDGQLTPRQFAILDEIADNPGISQTGLVDRTGIDRSTLADIVRRMLDKGLIQRERTAEDARAYAVKLTRKGTDARKKMKPLAQTVDKQLLAAVPKAHREIFVSVLAEMVTNLQQDEPEKTA
jgi:DNA-binding MarR family transcriptional regulator